MGCGASAYDQPADIKTKYYPNLVATLLPMDGKVVAITGCTTGTGFILAKTCAKLGAKVIMLNRPSARADEALDSIKKEFPDADVTLVPCDLMTFKSVREAAAKLQEDLKESGLHVLCNNAGIMAVKDEATVDGYDVQMQVNHLSHFLLTAELWPLLKQAASASGEARVVNHSSVAREGKTLDAKYLGKNGGDLGGDAVGVAPFTGARWDRYHHTKLANLCFTYALDDKLKAAGSQVKSLVAHPGYAATNLQVTTHQDGGLKQAGTLTKNLAQSQEDGTCGILTCCCAKDVASGQFYGPKGFTGPAILMPEEKERKLADEASREMLWAESIKATEVSWDV